MDCFWAQLFDPSSKEKLLRLWNVVNHEINLTKANSNDLSVNNFYVVEYEKEKYRAKLIDFLHGPKKKYKVKKFFHVL